MARDSESPNTLADFRDDQHEPTLVAHIHTHLDERLGVYEHISSKQDYLSAASSFPDAAMEYFCILAKLGSKDYVWLWLLVLYRLAKVSNTLSHYKQLLVTQLDIQVSSANAILGPQMQQVARHCEIFNDTLDVRFLVGEKLARTWFLKYVGASLGLCTTDHTYLKHGSLVVSVTSVISRYYKSLCFSDEAELYECKVDLLPSLVEIGKVAFYTGVPHAVLPLIFGETAEDSPVSESFLLPILLDAGVTLPLITDYYKYHAFCLVTIVVEAPAIEDTLVNKADVFLKVLLSLPQLSLANYMQEALATSDTFASAGPRLITGLQREEISFFYLLNYLLRLRSLADFVDPEKTFSKERQYFIASFNKRCGAELEFSASASSSRTGSVVSIPKAGESYHGASPHVTLSCILSEGTYKEKVRLVAEFFNLAGENSGAGSARKLVETFDMSGIHHRSNNFGSGVSHIFHRIDPQLYPGKVAYVKALDSIVRLLQLVSLSHMSATFGSSFQGADFLGRLFNTGYSLREVMQVKDLLDLGEDNVVRARYRVAKSEQELLAKQFRLLESTRALKSDVQKLI